MTPDSFNYIRQLLQKKAAIVLDDSKSYLVKNRLSPLAIDEGLNNIDDLVSKLQANPRAPLVNRMIDAMTTNETFFFRDRGPFELFRFKLLPEMVKRLKSHSRINIWSAACSSGQEPYSLVMLMMRYFPREIVEKINVIGSDVSERMLEKARDARYSNLEVERGLPDDYRDRFFNKDGENWQLKNEIRERVKFRNLNLIDQWPLMPPIDLVLLRNVMVYFDNDSRKQILGKIRNVMSSSGVLILGGSESTHGLDDNFERVLTDFCSYYRLVGKQ